MMNAPRSRSLSRFSWVAGLSYMWPSIAGAMTRGAEDARMVVVRASSAMPWASLAMQWTVAGATRMRSALCARATCSTASSDWVSNISVITGL